MVIILTKKLFTFPPEIDFISIGGLHLKRSSSQLRFRRSFITKKFKSAKDVQFSRGIEGFS